MSVERPSTVETCEVEVVLPHQLRARAGGARSVRVQGSSVRELVDALDREVPGLAFSICHETGELRPYVNVFVGQENVRFLQGIDTPVRPGEVVHIIHSVAGG